jgi:O-antigen/teichoic acid export membrane protein
MLISLYTSRVILNVLGVTDFGIYNVVGGFVSMFALINGGMSSVTQRFLNFEMGKKNAERLNQVFSAAVFIHTILAIIILILGETIGLWFLNTQLNIAEERMIAAQWVFQCSLLTFCLNLICVPYNATIIAHEKMNAFAYISILETLLKLGIVFLLQWILMDKLISYALLMLAIAIIIRIIYGNYCKKHFKEAVFVFCKDKVLYKEMTSFTGWTFIGNSSTVLKGQGVNILINIYYGVTLNAARGIANQVEHAIESFISNFMTAMKPQITKSYASGEHAYMTSLVIHGSKFSFYLLLLLSLPILIETKTILTLWLKIVPDYTVVFLRLSLIYALLHTLSTTLTSGINATGKIKKYQLIVGGINLLNFPLSFLLLFLGVKPQITYIVAILLECINLGYRIRLSRGLFGLDVKFYLRNVVLNVGIVAVVASIFPYLISYNMAEGIMRFLCATSVALICTALSIYYIGLNSRERKYLLEKVSTIRRKIF